MTGDFALLLWHLLIKKLLFLPVLVCSFTYSTTPNYPCFDFFSNLVSFLEERPQLEEQPQERVQDGLQLLLPPIREGFMPQHEENNTIRQTETQLTLQFESDNLDAILRTSLASHYPDMGEVRLETLILEIAALITIEGSINHYPNQLLSLTLFFNQYRRVSRLFIQPYPNLLDVLLDGARMLIYRPVLISLCLFLVFLYY